MFYYIEKFQIQSDSVKSVIINHSIHNSDELFVKTILKKYSHDYRKCLYYDEKGIEHIKYTNYGTWVTDKIYGQ